MEKFVERESKTDRDLAKLRMVQLKYNILSKKLFFDFLVENQILKDYREIIEQAPIMALSLSRLLADAKKTGARHVLNKNGEFVREYLISDNYVPFNTYNINGTQGRLFFKREGTFIGETSQNTKNLHRFFSRDRTLLLVQGQPEVAFYLSTSEYDKVFGDVCDIDDIETHSFYKQLYSYMIDYYRNHRGEIDINHIYAEDREIEKSYHLIYAHDKRIIK